MSERIPMDLSTYEQQVRSGDCFICGLLTHSVYDRSVYLASSTITNT